MSDEDALEKLLPPGTVLCNKYEIIRILGRGGMGVVAQARHLRMNRDVALKILLPALRAQPEVVTRFEREARAASQLTDPHVTRVLDVDALPDGSPFMVMELLRGLDLAQILAKQGKLPYREAVGYLLEACAGMIDAHRAGVIHRDLKPNNLFVDTQGASPTLKILDFGISKIIGDVNASMTQTSTTFGTPLYMSPEQVRSMKSVDGRTDIWSLGVVLYELLAGEPPFHGPTATAILAAIIADDPVPIDRHRPDLPRPLAEAVMRALEKNVNERYRDVASFAAALAPFGPTGDGAAIPANLAAAFAAPPGGASTGMTSEQGIALRTAQRPEAPTTTQPAPGRPLVSIAIGMSIALVLGTVILITAVRKRPPATAIAENAPKTAPTAISTISTTAPRVAPADTAAPMDTAPANTVSTNTVSANKAPSITVSGTAPAKGTAPAPASTPGVAPAAPAKPTAAPAPPAPKPPTEEPPRYL